MSKLAERRLDRKVRARVRVEEKTDQATAW
jgi:hypothetical protein